MKKNDRAAAITAALQKLGPSAPRQILDEVGGSERKLGYYLRKMFAAKALKATGTSIDRVYALPGQRLKGATGTRAAPEAAIKTVITLNQPIAARAADGRIVLVRADCVGVAAVLDAEFAAPLAELLKKAA